MHHSDALIGYVNSVYRSWRRRGVDPEVEDLLYEHLGNGLISVLTSRIKRKRLVTKTPSVRNLNYFFKLFPNAYLLILVRDGRAVTESRVKSFGESYETAMRKWADGADTILHFCPIADRFHFKYLVVRYEDLWNDLNGELERIFGFLGLAADKYDFKAAADLPVRGSSVFHGQGEKDVHWKPIKKPADFDPVGRWSHWSTSLHGRFNWLAGQKQARLGYEQQQGDGSKFSWVLWNKVKDAKWQLLQLSRSIWRIAKETLKSIFGAARMSKARRRLLDFARPLSN